MPTTALGRFAPPSPTTADEGDGWAAATAAVSALMAARPPPVDGAA
jgi:hypothetical protein